LPTAYDAIEASDSRGRGPAPHNPPARGADRATLTLSLAAACAAALGGISLSFASPLDATLSGARILTWTAAALALGGAILTVLRRHRSRSGPEPSPVEASTSSTPARPSDGGGLPDPRILVKAIETMPVGLTIADTEGLILYANPADAAMHGYSREELIGQHVSIYSAEESRAPSPSVSTYGLWERDRLNVTRDGRTFPVRLTSDMVRDERGQPTANITLCEDITERKATEEALVEREAAYRTLFESASDLVVCLELDGRIHLANRSAIDSLGLDPFDRAPRLEEVVSPEHRERWLQAFGQVIEEGGAKIELVLRTRTGEEVPLEGRLDLRRQGGRPAEVLGIFREVRERHAIDRLREEFVSVVNHELRTPLTSMLGALSLLQEGAVPDRPERFDELLKIAARNGDRLLLLIDGLLDLQKMSAGLLRFDLSPMSLGPLLEEAIEDMEGYAEAAGVRLELDILPREIMITADRDRLLHVLFNLISNAIKFSPDGETVSILARESERAASVTVRDRGPGIPPDFRDRLFDPFTQSQSSSERRSGSGLGMTIAKRFVEGLGGSIDARICPDGGTAVSIELPTATDS